MTVEEKRCGKCGQINKKSDIYCVNCGILLDTPEIFLTDQEKIDQGKTNDISIIDRFKQLNFGFKMALYFGIVVLVDLVLSIILMLSLGLPIESYFFLFLGFFLLTMGIVGIIWNIAVTSDFSAHLGKAISRMIVWIIIFLIIIIPIYVLFALPSMLGSLSVTISLPPAVNTAIEAINDAITGVFEAFLKAFVLDPISEMFSSLGDSIDESVSNVEVPGFEPFLLISIFLIASIIIIYKYHLITRKP